MRIGTGLLATLAALAAACGHEAALVSRPATPTRSLVVRNVRVFDAPHAALLDGARDVLVRDGRIAAIAPPGLPADGTPELDGHGGTLLPGLVDAHAHTAGASDAPGHVALPDVGANFAAYLYAGVTTALDLGDMSPAIFRERARVADGTRLGPRLYVAGPIFTAPGGHPAEVLRAALPWYLRWYVVPRATREVGSPEAARHAVADLLPERPDILKLAVDAGTGDVPVLPVETIAALTSAGHAAGIRSIAHVGSSAEAMAAIKGGVDALAHSPWRDELTDDAVAAIAAAHAPVVVTLAIWDALEWTRTHAGDFLPIEREVTPLEVLARFLAPLPPGSLDPAAVRAVTAAHDARRRNFARLHAAGVTILAGSDSCNSGAFPGAGLHVELAKLVEAGFTPGEALRAATWENARFVARGDADFGEVAVGKRADLLLVAGDPTARIDDLQHIDEVIVDGTALTRRSLR
jgi:imidazolonepropionase-like amidohydrolase